MNIMKLMHVLIMLYLVSSAGDLCYHAVQARVRVKNVCNSQPCQNGGQCIDLSEPSGVKRFECSCLEGFEGITCQKRIDPCGREPCLNGGVCMPKGEYYHCICPEEFQGSKCEQPKKQKSPCTERPCGAHGVCEVLNDGFVCECFPGYYGARCEEQKAAAVDSGVKMVEVEAAGGTASSIRDMLIVLIVFLVLLLIVLALMCLHCWRVYNRRSDFKAMREQRQAAGEEDTGCAPGWLDTSNTLCYEFFCCQRKPQGEERNSLTNVSGIILPLREYEKLLRDKGKHRSISSTFSKMSSRPFRKSHRVEERLSHEELTAQESGGDEEEGREKEEEKEEGEKEQLLPYVESRRSPEKNSNHKVSSAGKMTELVSRHNPHSSYPERSTRSRSSKRAASRGPQHKSSSRQHSRGEQLSRVLSRPHSSSDESEELEIKGQGGTWPASNNHVHLREDSGKMPSRVRSYSGDDDQKYEQNEVTSPQGRAAGTHTNRSDRIFPKYRSEVTMGMYRDYPRLKAQRDNILLRTQSDTVYKQHPRKEHSTIITTRDDPTTHTFVDHLRLEEQKGNNMLQRHRRDDGGENYAEQRRMNEDSDSNATQHYVDSATAKNQRESARLQVYEDHSQDLRDYPPMRSERSNVMPQTYSDEFAPVSRSQVSGYVSPIHHLLVGSPRVTVEDTGRSAGGRPEPRRIVGSVRDVDHLADNHRLPPENDPNSQRSHLQPTQVREMTHDSVQTEDRGKYREDRGYAEEYNPGHHNHPGFPHRSDGNDSRLTYGASLDGGRSTRLSHLRNSFAGLGQQQSVPVHHVTFPPSGHLALQSSSVQGLNREAPGILHEHSSFTPRQTVQSGRSATSGLYRDTSTGMYREPSHLELASDSRGESYDIPVGKQLPQPQTSGSSVPTLDGSSFSQRDHVRASSPRWHSHNPREQYTLDETPRRTYDDMPYQGGILAPPRVSRTVPNVSVSYHQNTRGSSRLSHEPSKASTLRLPDSYSRHSDASLHTIQGTRREVMTRYPHSGEVLASESVGSSPDGQSGDSEEPPAGDTGLWESNQSRQTEMDQAHQRYPRNREDRNGCRTYARYLMSRQHPQQKRERRAVRETVDNLEFDDRHMRKSVTFDSSGVLEVLSEDDVSDDTQNTSAESDSADNDKNNSDDDARSVGESECGSERSDDVDIDDDDEEDENQAYDDDGYASTTGRLSESDAGGRSRDPQSLHAYSERASRRHTHTPRSERNITDHASPRRRLSYSNRHSVSQPYLSGKRRAGRQSNSSLFWGTRRRDNSTEEEDQEEGGERERNYIRTRVERDKTGPVIYRNTRMRHPREIKSADKAHTKGTQREKVTPKKFIRRGDLFRNCKRHLGQPPKAAQEIHQVCPKDVLLEGNGSQNRGILKNTGPRVPRSSLVGSKHAEEKVTVVTGEHPQTAHKSRQPSGVIKYLDNHSSSCLKGVDSCHQGCSVIPALRYTRGHVISSTTKQKMGTHKISTPQDHQHYSSNSKNDTRSVKTKSYPRHPRARYMCQ
ncbi:uncharacterized protein LOC101848637 [Aplysia californica]|uniref:Uncharacterized protein LOC101848637 n=1 Tax=Aplysia californica TaxID=6500 RepID=A0ABM1A9E2_APLCA|nr:uncharacterized protein LOC101848637 [Aplysia californica]